ncbi:MAG: addiction module protein [Spirochaetales bacterium]|nr:addiction module protein [Spirochaetales bacterium]
MVNKNEHILVEILKLNPVDRVQLLEDIFESFEATDRTQIDEYWAEVAENRIDAYNKNLIQAVSMEDVFKGVE